MNSIGFEELFTPLIKGFTSEEFSMIYLQSMIASEISIHRVNLGMSQKDFAKKMKVSQSTVSKWESGETNFTLATLVHIADLLNIEIQSVFKSTPPAACLSAVVKESDDSKYNNVISFDDIKASSTKKAQYSTGGYSSTLNHNDSKYELLEM